MTQALFEWPALITPKSRRIRDRVYHRYYPVPEHGELVGVTTFLKVVGTGTDALMGWAADQERAAAVEAALWVASRSRITGASPEFAAAIESRLGPSRAHVAAVSKAADIGTEIHDRIKWDMAGLTGQKRVLGQPELTQSSAIGYLAFQNWWLQAGYRPVRSEQTVWHPGLGYAGTVDLFAVNPANELGILDFKSSKYVYDTHHLQLKAYWLASLALGLPVTWGQLIHLPKEISQLQGGEIVKVVELGDMYDRTLTHKELEESVHDALRLWRRLCERPTE